MNTLFYIEFEVPSYPMTDQDTIDFWNEWDTTKEYIISTTTGGQRLVLILPAPLEKGTVTVLDALRTKWAISHKAKLVGSNEILELFLRRVQRLSVAASEAQKLLKRTRSSRNRLWYRDVAKARRLLGEALLSKE